MAAFILGAPVGILGNLARASGAKGLAFRLAVPAVALLEMYMRLMYEASGEKSIIVNTWIATLVAAVITVLAVVGHTVFSWRRAARTQTRGPHDYAG
ncbi:hypothetical protein QEZ40_003877 [Streptomyces katrae]|uniref:Threonine/Serine exporter ThrE domain-containing protein n=1 Tax=Streptomyces katrae TaxID=68223 RepID=A0ABT7GYJ5_9ACTN|nr:hypothetical protein [Streptomyces katrae]MDK9498684.1 hypothetical protein [Streptomyces katrae]